MSDETIPIQKVRRVLNRLMLHHESEMNRLKDVRKMREIENDYALFAKIDIEIAIHQTAWNAVFDVAKVLQIGLHDTT